MKLLVVPLAAVLIVILIAAVLLLTTPYGIRLAADQAMDLINARSDSRLLIENISGSLAGSLCADSVVYRQSGVDVSVSEVCADIKLWSSIDFLSVNMATVRARLVDIQTTASADAPVEPIVRRSLDLPVNLTAESLIAEKLIINTLELDSIRTSVRLSNDDLAAEGDLNYQELPVHLLTSGGWARFQAVLASGSLQAEALLDLEDPDLRFSAEVNADRLDLERWLNRPLTLQRLVVQAAGNLTGFNYSIRSAAADAAIGAADLNLSGELQSGGMTLSGNLSRLSLIDVDLQIDALPLEGAIQWAEGFRWQASTGPQGIHLNQSGFAVTGNAQLELQGDAERLSATGVLQQVRADSDGLAGLLNAERAAELSASASALSVNGSVDWAADVIVQVQSSTDRLQADWDARSITTSGRWQVDYRQGAFQIDARDMVGLFDAESLEAEFNLALAEGERYELRDARLQIGTSTLSGSGSYGPSGILLRANSRMFPLALLQDQVSGLLSGEIKLDGKPDDPTVSATLSIEDLDFEAFQADQADIRLNGLIHAGNAELEVAREGLQASTRVEYDWQGESIRLGVSAFDAILDDPQAGRVQLTLMDPVTIQIDGPRIDLPESCLLLDVAALTDTTARICGSVTWPEGPLMLSAPTVTLPELALLSGDLILGGRLSADVRMSSLQPPVGSGAIRIENLSARDARSNTTEALGDVALDLSFADQKLNGQISTPAAQSLKLNGQVSSLFSEPLLDSELAGKIDASLAGIWIVESLLPMDITYSLADVTGQVALVGEVSGTIKEPLLNGEVSFTEAGWSVPAVGLTLSEVNLIARLLDSERLTLSSTGVAGGGAFELTGELTDITEDSRVLKATFSTETANLIDLPDYTAWISGKLTLEVRDDALITEGDLKMPKALLKISEIPESAVVISDDAVIVGEQQVVTAQQFRQTELALALGKNVRLQAFGLDTFLEGKLRFIETPGAPPQLLGAINLREGTFEAYGQELNVERGVLTFNGPLDDPAVNVTATRTVNYEDRDYLITLRIGGTALALTTDVTSSPSLPESDALALLITGRTFSESTASEQNNVYGAALALGLFGMTGISENVATQLNLEEIIVDQDTEGNFEVGAAIRLNRDLYLRYTYNVFSRLGGVLLRYRLSRRFSVQATTGDTHSIEVRYGVDN